MRDQVAEGQALQVVLKMEALVSAPSPSTARCTRSAPYSAWVAWVGAAAAARVVWEAGLPPVAEAAAGPPVDVVREQQAQVVVGVGLETAGVVLGVVVLS
jgi:predicted lysophospholipase L1 biosynthesis ABC-type transport system permease subunit